MKKTAIAAVLAALLVAGLASQPAHAAAAKVGKSCVKVGVKTTVNGINLVCKKKGSKKVWAVAPAALGSLQNPAPVGAAVNTGKFKVAFLGFTDNVSSYVCSQNMFNTGCKIDDNFDGVPDLTQNSRWVRVQLSVTNTTNVADDFYQLDTGVVGNGVINWQGLFQPVADDRIDNNSVLPGMSTTGALYLYLPNSQSMGMFVLKTDFGGTMYFFKAY
jgi:hypothetical protein